MSSPSLILASRSPRRAELLREAGYSFDIMPSPFVDPPMPALANAQGAQALAMELASQKARALGEQLSSAAIIIGADTIVVQGDSALGTPRSQDEARDMLMQLSGAMHRVITAVSVLCANCDRASDNQNRTFADVAEVMFGPIENNTLDRYIQSGAWRGKAGGYNLFEVHDQWLASVTGDPTTVVGLPMKKLVPMLNSFSFLQQEKK